MIDLYLCRHGEATFDAPSDRSRPLTERGITQTQAQAQSWKEKLEGQVTAIWASDFLRAQQTAQIFSRSLSIPVRTELFFGPDSPAKRALERLFELYQGSERHCVLVVSHMPLLGDLLSLLVEGHTFEPHPFQTSEIVHVRGELIGAGFCELVKS